jgi:hypothetical protein
MTIARTLRAASLAALPFLAWAWSAQAQTSADWTSTEAGTLAGVSFTVTEDDALLDVATADFSGTDYDAAPLPAGTEALSWRKQTLRSTLTITFSEPVSGLLLHAQGGNLGEGATLDFFQEVVIESGFDGVALSPPGTLSFSGVEEEVADGVLSFNDPVSSLTIRWDRSCNSACGSALLLTFAVMQDEGEDTDEDTIPDDVDNCPATPNPEQTDTDGDEMGDACDADDDNDGFPDESDACPLVFGTGPHGCPPDEDADGDGVPDATDNCPGGPNPDQLDTDGDGDGDVCDPDDDNDGFPDAEDPCPLEAGVGDQPCPEDVDTDDDGVLDEADNCPLIANPDQDDSDDDGDGDACDVCPIDPENDADGDGFCADLDNCPLDANTDQADTDGDGVGDACDDDDDDDGVDDRIDNCPLDPNEDQADTDGDGIGDVCDEANADQDGDGVPDEVDQCLPTAPGEVVDETGCSVADLCPCDRKWKDSSAHLACTVSTASRFAAAGLITPSEALMLSLAAVEAKCGKVERKHHHRKKAHKRGYRKHHKHGYGMSRWDRGGKSYRHGHGKSYGRHRKKSRRHRKSYGHGHRKSYRDDRRSWYGHGGRSYRRGSHRSYERRSRRYYYEYGGRW